MDGAGAVFAQALHMQGGAVALVLGKLVFGIQAVILKTNAVTGDLG